MFMNRPLLFVTFGLIGWASSWSGSRSKKELSEKIVFNIWELLMQYKIHGDAVVQVLHERKVSTNTTPQQLVSSLMQKPEGAIMFTDEDLPLEGREHYRPLFIKAEIKGKMTCCVMVDNGSAINVCPLKILPRLSLTVADLKPSDVIIKAYDDTKRSVEGTFKTLVKTGPIEAWVTLHVIDIPITFAVLLRRPWFHPLGGVPSTLHQKIKFPYEGKIVTITTESEAAIAALKLAPKEIPLNPDFEVCMIYEDSMEEKVLNMLKRMNFMPRLGLGKNQSGPPEFMEAKLQILKYRLGYHGEKDGPDSEEKWSL